MSKAADAGYICQLGVEPEFYVFKPESLGGSTLIPIALSEEIEPTPAYDMESALDSMPFLDKVCDYMEALDIGLFQF